MFRFILNLPYTLVGLIFGIFSLPLKVDLKKDPYAVVFYVRKLWWTVGYMKNARAVTIGHMVLLGSNSQDKDLEHELIHVEQHQRIPIFFPFLYAIELYKRGYKDNIYEIEAYKRAENIYKGDI